MVLLEGQDHNVILSIVFHKIFLQAMIAQIVLYIQEFYGEMKWSFNPTVMHM